MENNILIYSYRLANELLKQGFLMDEIKQNTTVRNKLVFYFKREEELVDLLEREYNIKVEG